MVTTDYAMYTDAGNLAVGELVMDPILVEIDNVERDLLGFEKAKLRHDLHQQLEAGMERVAKSGHREVWDTDVRELLYGEIGKKLIERGFATDRFNWELE